MLLIFSVHLIQTSYDEATLHCLSGHSTISISRKLTETKKLLQMHNN